MTPDQCSQLVNLIVSTWPTGPKGHVWTDTLGDLEPGPALATYRQLRNDEERPPAIARFIATYRHLHPPEHATLNVDPHEELIPLSDPRARAAFARGLADALADRQRMTPSA